MFEYENYNTTIVDEKRNSYFLPFKNVEFFKIKNIYLFVRGSSIMYYF